MAYGDNFLQGTTSTATIALGWTLADSGKPNGATAIGVGNIDTTSGPVNNDLAIATVADNFGAAIGSKIVENGGSGSLTTDRAGVAEARGDLLGTLAFNPSPTGTRSETFIIQGFTTKISNVANTAIQGGTVGDGTYDNTHGTIKSGSGTFAAGSFNALATPSTNIRPTYTREDEDVVDTSYTFKNPADGTPAVATEIFPTRAVPGELTYHFGGLAKPTTDEYKAKDEEE
jgi:hypothetical protein